MSLFALLPPARMPLYNRARRVMMRLFPKSVTLTALALFLSPCDALRPLPTTEDRTKVVETAIFEGGYGIGWHLKMAEEFNAAHAADGIEISLWGDPRTSPRHGRRIPQIVRAPVR